MQDFERRLYEALLVAYGKILCKYNAFAQGSILRDVGKEIVDYLTKYGFEFEESGTEADLGRLTQLFIENGFAERLEVEPATPGQNYIWHNLYGVDAYRELHQISDNPFLACPLNACLYYLMEKLNKTMRLHRKSFDMDSGIVESQYELKDKDPAEEKEEGFSPLVVENARLYELAAEHAEQLQKALDELQTFAHVVSHDLKAPLRGISSLAEWIQADCGDQLNEQGHEQFRMLIHRVEHMQRLIDDILKYSRVGQCQGEPEPVELATLIPEVIESLAVAEHIRITVEQPLPCVHYDRTRISQIFQNLLSNAVKYMDKEQGLIQIVVSEDEQAWTFGIADNGPGIPEKYFDKIFAIFQTLAPKDQYESTGVGLALVKKIVEGCGGRIWVTSQVGQGSTFSFTVPKAVKGLCSQQANPVCAQGQTE
jgi:signal transduction histidine kinase